MTEVLFCHLLVRMAEIFLFHLLVKDDDPNQQKYQHDENEYLPAGLLVQQ